jgi:predicted HTH domain antitoxin
MHSHPDTHTEAALYWAAISLIVCEGLSVGKAAERLGIETRRLRNILRQRRQHSPLQSRPDLATFDKCH